MKKRIIIGLSIFALIFFAGGIYIVSTIEKATSTLDRLIRLHQVEILREQLLTDARRVQADLAFKGTHYARELDTVVLHVLELGNQAQSCLGCHHSEEITAKITDLIQQVRNYKDALSRVLTIRANTARLEVEERRAVDVGQELVDQLTTMTALTRARLDQRTRSSLQAIGEMKSVLFVLISIGPILAIGLAVIFIKGFTRPVKLLLQATRRVKGGDLSVRIQGLQDEFGEVAASFNEMTASLNEQMQNMQRAEHLKMVGEMAAGLVHEVKNPLAGIKASIQILLQEGNVPKEDRMILTAVLGEVNRIDSLMKGLLDFARPPKPQFMPVDMNSVVESSITLSLPYSSVASGSRKAIEIIKHLDSGLPMVMADPGQMQQVLLNLLMNAVEAMPEGGTLTVSTSGNPENGTSGDIERAIQIKISDTGKGINEETRKKIFQPFFTTKRKGTGLGLAVTKRFIEMHSGTISVDQTPGGGTTFRILLPRTTTEEGNAPSQPLTGR
jgi:signal transduction histidine kinase